MNVSSTGPQQLLAHYSEVETSTNSPPPTPQITERKDAWTPKQLKILKKRRKNDETITAFIKRVAPLIGKGEDACRVKRQQLLGPERAYWNKKRVDLLLRSLGATSPGSVEYKAALEEIFRQTKISAEDSEKKHEERLKIELNNYKRIGDLKGMLLDDQEILGLLGIPPEELTEIWNRIQKIELYFSPGKWTYTDKHKVSVFLRERNFRFTPEEFQEFTKTIRSVTPQMVMQLIQTHMKQKQPHLNLDEKFVIACLYGKMSLNFLVD